MRNFEGRVRSESLKKRSHRRKSTSARVRVPTGGRRKDAQTNLCTGLMNYKRGNGRATAVATSKTAYDLLGGYTPVNIFSEWIGES